MGEVSEVSQSLLKPHEEQEVDESQNERQEVGIKVRMERVLHNLQQKKSTEILKYAVKCLASSGKFMFIMILASVPFFVFMLIYELYIPKLLNVIPELLVQPSNTYYYEFSSGEYIFYDENEGRRKPLHDFLQLFPFHLVLSPLVELFGLSIIINVASELDLGQKELGLKEALYELFYQKNKVKGPFVTCVLVQLLSTSTLVGLFWILANHFIITSGIYNYFSSSDYCIYILSIGIHAVIFVALLYKFLDWSAMWNMSIVISVLEEEAGFDALEVSAFCGKHSRKTGFQLMLAIFAFSVGVRLPLLLGSTNDVNLDVGTLVNGLVLVMLCLGNLVKWVAVVLYYYDCKAHILLKKVDEEVGKSEKVCDV